MLRCNKDGVSGAWNPYGEVVYKFRTNTTMVTGSIPAITSNKEVAGQGVWTVYSDGYGFMVEWAIVVLAACLTAGWLLKMHVLRMEAIGSSLGGTISGEENRTDFGRRSDSLGGDNDYPQLSGGSGSGGNTDNNSMGITPTHRLWNWNWFRLGGRSGGNALDSGGRESNSEPLRERGAVTVQVM
eukprot:Platyproteum_vivax@DN13430_c0_g1_i1.p1